MLQKLLRIALPVVIVSLVIIGVFWAYLTFVGVPKTQARNLYNSGVLAIKGGNLRGAMEDFRSAYSYWPEDYIQTSITQLQLLLD